MCPKTCSEGPDDDNWENELEFTMGIVRVRHIQAVASPLYTPYLQRKPIAKPHHQRHESSMPDKPRILPPSPSHPQRRHVHTRLGSAYTHTWSRHALSRSPPRYIIKKAYPTHPKTEPRPKPNPHIYQYTLPTHTFPTPSHPHHLGIGTLSPSPPPKHLNPALVHMYV